jgi:hypothetical protein
MLPGQRVRRNPTLDLGTGYPDNSHMISVNLAKLIDLYHSSRVERLYPGDLVNGDGDRAFSRIN